MPDLTPITEERPSVVETPDGLFLVAPDGTVLEELAGPDDCMECGDDFDVDPTTGLCEMCFEHVFGSDFSECETCHATIIEGDSYCQNCERAQ